VPRLKLVPFGFSCASTQKLKLDTALAAAPISASALAEATIPVPRDENA
jgi:hypothetical protein